MRPFGTRPASPPRDASRNTQVQQGGSGSSCYRSEGRSLVATTTTVHRSRVPESTRFRFPTSIDASFHVTLAKDDLAGDPRACNADDAKPLRYGNLDGADAHPETEIRPADGRRQIDEEVPVLDAETLDAVTDRDADVGRKNLRALSRAHGLLPRTLRASRLRRIENPAARLRHSQEPLIRERRDHKLGEDGSPSGRDGLDNERIRIDEIPKESERTSHDDRTPFETHVVHESTNRRGNETHEDTLAAHVTVGNDVVTKRDPQVELDLRAVAVTTGVQNDGIRAGNRIRSPIRDDVVEIIQRTRLTRQVPAHVAPGGRDANRTRSQGRTWRGGLEATLRDSRRKRVDRDGVRTAAASDRKSRRRT